MTAPGSAAGVTLGAALDGDVVHLELAALPVHVRTARLVTAAAARRAGLDGSYVDELKLAVGEAVTRAVHLHAAHAPHAPVEVALSWTATTLSVVVGDRGPEGAEVPDGDAGDLEDLDAAAADGHLPPGLGLALVQGLVDDVAVEPRDGGGTVVTMRWPLTA